MVLLLSNTMCYHQNAITVLFIYLLLLPFHLSSSSNNGFTVPLIRRRFGDKSSSSSTTPVHAYLGQYLMKISLGTPPLDIFGIADTGSDLVWTQCLPCDTCYNQTNPKFDPTKSSSYKTLPCKSDQCHVVGFTSPRDCPPENDFPCHYMYGYASGDLTRGVIAKDTLTLSSQTFDGVVFGCGHNNTATTFNNQEMGIVGLGTGPLSLPTQLFQSFGLKKIFSHCLVPFHTDVSITSQISFGESKISSVNAVVSTPMVSKPPATFYFVTLNGISVGPTYLPFNPTSSVPASKGNMFLDSGTPPTILPQSLYDRVAEEVRKQVTTMQPIVGDPELGTQLCYKTEKNLDGPILKAHFDGGDVELGPTQIFIPPKDGVYCFAMTNTSAEVGIYGNFAQSNYLIEFDLERQLVSFKSTDCTKQ